LPALEAGDTVTTVTSAYISEFNEEINKLANDHRGCDSGQIVYVDFEGESTGNFNDIVTIYMVRYGVGDTATIMNETSKSRLKAVFDDMCSYTTDTGSEDVENEDGTTQAQTVFYVNVTLKTCYDMMEEYHFDADQIELVEEMMQMFGSTSSVTSQSSLTQAEIDSILQDITDSRQKSAVSFALTKVGYPYSQQYRDSGNYFDCSSLTYYSWKAAGIDIRYGGANTAAAEAEGLERAGRTVSYSEMQPGDLIFYSYAQNGRYRNISHVALYVGDGMVVEAKGTAYGVTYNKVPNPGKIVLIGRPQ
jgi:cell wall-associated NlpC family hydrolase